MIMNGSSSQNRELCNGKIVYVAAGTGGRADIYSVDSDGSGTSKLTENPEFDGYPNWSFDGEKIVFVASEEKADKLYIMDSDGSNKTLIEETETGKISPSWSPDHQRIAYIAIKPGFSYGEYEIRILNLDSLETIQAIKVQEKYNVFPLLLKWSPDGRYIAFSGLSSSLEGSQVSWESHIFLIDVQDNTITELIDGLAGELDFDWSPNGQEMVLVLHEEGHPNTYVMSIENSEKIKVDFGINGGQQGIAWSPDGERIAFLVDNHYLYSANIAGSDLIKLLEIGDIIGDETRIKTVIDWQPVDCSTDGGFD